MAEPAPEQYTTGQIMDGISAAAVLEAVERGPLLGTAQAAAVIRG
jgi:hypothetical protein